MKKIYISTLVLVMLFASALATQAIAASPAFDNVGEENIYIPSGTVVNAPFLGAGANIELNGTMQDDVFLFGALITINGDVDGDVFAFGSVITVNGNVSGSVRGAGSTININGSVGKNVMMAGALVTISPDATIGKNLIAAGAQVLAQGSVGKNIHAAGAQIVIDAPVGGSAYLVADEDGGIIIRQNAQIAGNLEYSAYRDADIADGAVIVGESTMTLIERGAPAPRHKAAGEKAGSVIAGLYVAFSIFSLLSLLVVTLVYISLFKKFNDETMKVASKNPITKFLLGLATVVVTPILLILIAVTVIGIPLAVLGLMTFAIALYVSKIVISLWAGDAIIRALRNKKNKNNAVNKYIAALVGVLAVSLILAIPGIGWLLKVVVVGWGMGVLVTVTREKLNLA